MTNKNNTVIYIVVTSVLLKRVYQHKTKTFKGFTSKHNCDKLVYFEEFTDIYIKPWQRKAIKIWQWKTKSVLDKCK